MVAIIMGIVIAFGLSSAVSLPYTPISVILPFLCLGRSDLRPLTYLFKSLFSLLRYWNRRHVCGGSMLEQLGPESRRPGAKGSQGHATCRRRHDSDVIDRCLCLWGRSRDGWWSLQRLSRMTRVYEFTSRSCQLSEAFVSVAPLESLLSTCSRRLGSLLFWPWIKNEFVKDEMAFSFVASDTKSPQGRVNQRLASMWCFMWLNSFKMAS